MCFLSVIGSLLVLSLPGNDRLLVWYWYAVGCIWCINQFMAHTGSIAQQILLFLYLDKNMITMTSFPCQWENFTEFIMYWYIILFSCAWLGCAVLCCAGLILIIYCIYFGLTWTAADMLSVHNGLLLVNYLPPLPQVKLLNQTADLQTCTLPWWDYVIGRSSGGSSLIAKISSYFCHVKGIWKG